MRRWARPSATSPTSISGSTRSPSRSNGFQSPPRRARTLHARTLLETTQRALAAGIAAAKAGNQVGDIGYAVATRTGVVSVLVDDADIVAARRDLWERHHIVVEHGAAAA